MGCTGGNGGYAKAFGDYVIGAVTYRLQHRMSLKLSRPLSPTGSGPQRMVSEFNGRCVIAMEMICPVDVAVERWQAETGKDAIRDDDAKTFAQMRTEWLGGTRTSTAGDRRGLNPVRPRPLCSR